jgi:ABC-type phosphate/phosphonate transport system ATPase subunit
VSRETGRRLRTQVKELEFSTSLIESRSVLWNTLAVAPRRLRMARSCFRLPWPGARQAAQDALEVVSLGTRAGKPVATLDRRERIHLRVARALVYRPECLLARDVDVLLSAQDAQTVLALLRIAAQDLSLVALASVENEWLACRSGDHAVVLDDGLITGVPAERVGTVPSRP